MATSPVSQLPTPHTYGITELPEAEGLRQRLLEALQEHGNVDLALEHLGAHLTTLNGGLNAQRPLLTHLAHGLAYTVGSALGQTPPSVQECLGAYEIPNKVGLTAGSKAWSKHAHRSLPPLPDTSNQEEPIPLLSVSQEDNGGKPPKPKKKKKEPKPQGWWGTPSGPIAQINERALAIFWKIMNNATWRNLHWLPHQVLVYEVRVEEGYGMRWSQDLSESVPGIESAEGSKANADVETEAARVELEAEGAEGVVKADAPSSQTRPWVFRGFLEPQMENGHELGWKHSI